MSRCSNDIGFQVKCKALCHRGSCFLCPTSSLHRYTAVVIAAVHIYLSVGHLSKLFAGPAQWTDIWKGFGALGGAYVFAALASHGFARYQSQLPALGVVVCTKND